MLLSFQTKTSGPVTHSFWSDFFYSSCLIIHLSLRSGAQRSRDAKIAVRKHRVVQTRMIKCNLTDQIYVINHGNKLVYQEYGMFSLIMILFIFVAVVVILALAVVGALIFRKKSAQPGPRIDPANVIDVASKDVK